MPSRALGTLLLLLLALGGCGGRSATPPDPRQEALVTQTAAALDRYWSAHPVSDAPWSAPARVSTFAEADPPEPACLDSWATNSAYCPGTRQIHLNRDWLPQLGRAFRDPRLATAYVLAHEYGRHVATVASVRPASPLGATLLADCYAGAFLGAVSRGETALELPAVRSILDSVRALGAHRASAAAWFAGGARGGPERRAQALATGFIAGPARGFCEGYGRLKEPNTVSGTAADLILPGDATAEPVTAPYTGMSVSTSAHPGLLMHTTDVSGRLPLDEALARYSPGEGTEYLGEPRVLQGLMAGYTGALRRYRLPGVSARSGVLAVAIGPSGARTYLSVSEFTEDEPDWTLLEDHAVTSLWGISG